MIVWSQPQKETIKTVMQMKLMLMKQISIKMIQMIFQVKAKEIKMNSKLSEVVMNLLDL